MSDYGHPKKIYIFGDYYNPGGVIARLEECGGVNRKMLNGDNASLVYVIAPDDTIITVESASMEYEWLTTNPHFKRLYPIGEPAVDAPGIFARMHRWVFKHDFDGYDVCASCVVASMAIAAACALIKAFGG